MIIETIHNIGEKLEINFLYDPGYPICTITSMEIIVLKNDEIEVEYRYKRDNTRTEGRFINVEDGKGNQTGWKLF